MKKEFFRLSLVLAAVAAMTGCAKELTVENNSIGSDFKIGLNIETKTTNDGLSTKWAEGDQINLFHAVAGTTDYISDGAFTVNPSTGEATGTLAAELDASKSYDWYAVYPYSESNTTPAARVIDLGYNTFHQANDGGMAHLAGLPLGGNSKGVAATSSVSIAMKNLLAVVKFEIYNHDETADATETLKDIWFQVGADDAALQIQGIFECNITGDEPVYTRANAGAIRPYLYFDNQSPIARNEMVVGYLPVIPFSVPAGTLMRVFPETTTTDNISCQFTTPRAIDLKPGHILTFTANTRGKLIPWKKGLKVYMGDASGNGAWDNAYRVEMPEDFQLSGSFDIKDLLSYVPDGASFAYSVPNSPASLSALPDASVLSSDGVWTVNSRLTSSCNINCWGDKDGVFIIFDGFPGGEQYAFLRMKNPFADLTNSDADGVKYLECSSLVFGSDTRQWALCGCPNYWSSAQEAGTTRDVVDYYIAIGGEDGSVGSNFKNAWYNLDLKNPDGETILSANPTTHRVALSEMAAKYCQHSNGLYWDWTWYNRWDGETWTDSGMDDSGKTNAAAAGITLSADGVITTDSTYDSTSPYRISVRQALQTDYDDLVFHYVGARWLFGCTAW